MFGCVLGVGWHDHGCGWARCWVWTQTARDERLLLASPWFSKRIASAKLLE